MNPPNAVSPILKNVKKSPPRDSGEADGSGGKTMGFTGVDDTYEPPPSPEIRINTVSSTAEKNVRQIPSYLVKRGFAAEYLIGTEKAGGAQSCDSRPRSPPEKGTDGYEHQALSSWRTGPALGEG